MRTQRPNSRKRARSKALVAGLAAAVLALAGCGGGDPSNGTKKLDSEVWSPAAKGDIDLLKWNIPFGEPGTLDAMQITSFSDAMAITNMCDPLLREAPDGTVTPALAESVDQVSPTKVVIKVAEGRTFWNGNPVTADDVQFSLERQRTDPRSLLAWVMANVESFVKTGPDTVEMNLKSPDYYLARQLVDINNVIYEKAYIQAKGDTFGTPQGGIMCSGPFKLDSWQAGQKLTLSRNDDYWDPELKPRAEKVELSFITDANTLTLALKSGQIDGSYGVPISGLDLLEQASSEGKVYYGPSPNVFNMMMVATDGKWADPRVREALALSVPYQDIATAIYKGAGVPAKSSIAEGGWPTDNLDEWKDVWDGLPEPKQDIAKAQQLLKEAGAEGLRLNLGGVSDQADWENALNAIADGATQAGFTVKIMAKPNSVYQPMLYDPTAVKDFDVITNEWNTDYHDPRLLFNSMRDDRWSRISHLDKVFNQKVDESISATDPKARDEAALAAQERAAELRDWIPVTYLYNRMWMNKRITGAPIAWGWWCYPFLAPVGAA